MAAAALDPPPRDCGMVEKGADVGEDDSVVGIVVVIDRVEPQRRIEEKTPQNRREERRRKIEEAAAELQRRK
ncbi:hypothetical protein C1H46_035769 [Malus baccata]|uniref:Uncharacterized protein n=1 Tax=Malus baccata TaxID=106549 RepID=A0A540KWQ3_MALBA|nr:hypothetical protein C1H46_035769 [Malus baccata]